MIHTTLTLTNDISHKQLITFSFLVNTNRVSRKCSDRVFLNCISICMYLRISICMYVSAPIQSAGEKTNAYNFTELLEYKRRFFDKYPLFGQNTVNITIRTQGC